MASLPLLPLISAVLLAAACSPGIPIGTLAPPTTQMTRAPVAHTTLLAVRSAQIGQPAPLAKEEHGKTYGLGLGPQPGNPGRVLFDFDLAALPPAARIHLATLVLVNAGKAHGPTLLLPKVEATIVVHRAHAPWTDAVTWATQPESEPVDSDVVTGLAGWNSEVTDPKGWNIDVTDTVRGWTSGASPNHGLMLLAQPEDKPILLRFYAPNGPDVYLMPRLEIAYE